jgi:hypothetical protein
LLLAEVPAVFQLVAGEELADCFKGMLVLVSEVLIM